VIELDPYAAHVTGTVFQSNEAPEAAVNVERLDWNGQPVGLQPDWETTQAISLEESGSRDEQPDWLTNVFDEPAARSAQTFDSPTIVPGADTAQDKPKAVPAFDDALPHPPGTEPAEDIPDFLREAGWGQSTGAFVEGKSAFKYEEPDTEPPIAKGELPDWVKAMAPLETEQPADEEEELPDWINKLETGVAATPVDSGEQPDWISQLDQPSQTQPESQPSDEQPDWLKGFSNESESMPAAPTEQTNWMSQIDQPAQAQSESQLSDDQLDWLKQLDQPEQPVPSASDDQPDWLKGFGSESESAPAVSSTEQLDWLGKLGEQAEPVSPEPSATEIDVHAAMEAEPEPAPPASVSSDLDSPVASTEEPEQPLPASPVPSMMDMDSLGTSKQERDDSFAWLENLAARQGASEGLLTKPEDRLEEEPDWVKRAKGLSTDQVPTPSAPAAQPAGNLEELGKSEQERDDSFAWLENLAARQGASEGLLTKPEDRLEQEPDWVKQARDLGAAAEQPPVSTIPAAVEEPSAKDDTATWLRSLDEEPTATPLSQDDATGMWLKSLDEEPVQVQPTQPAEQPEPELPAWMQNIEAEQPTQTSAPSASAEEAIAEGSDWMRPTEEPLEVQPTQPAEQPEAELPAWMQTIEAEKSAEAEPVVHEMEVEQPAQFDAMAERTQTIEADKSGEAEPVVHETEVEQPAQFDATSERMQTIEEEETAPASAITSPEEVTVEAADWKRSIEEPVEIQPVQPAEQPEEEIPAWMREIEEEKALESESVAPTSDIAAGPREIEAEQPAQLDNLPEWMQYIEDKKPAEEGTAALPASDTGTQEEATTADVSEWMGSIEEPVATSQDFAEEKPVSELEDIPAWLSTLEHEEAQTTTPAASDEDLPAWLRGEEGAAPEVSELEPTRAADWQPVEEKQPEPTPPLPEPISESFDVAQETPELATPSVEEREPEPSPSVSEPISESFDVAQEVSEPALSSLEEKEAVTPEPEPYKETVSPLEAAISAMPVDPILGRARDDLSQGKIQGALHTYGRLIRKTRLLDEVIYDLRDALYRFPVDVGIWQALGDAYMRANRLQDALDAYTKAEELLR
jgi:hypothetical protein